MSQDTSTKSLQNGVFRTNCVDSLDRTNVVQSMLAAKVLHQQFVVSLHVFRIKLTTLLVAQIVDFVIFSRNLNSQAECHR